MAIDGELNRHEQTYSGFTSMLKWGTAGCFLAVLIIIFLIAS